jgi:sucrose-6-phosphate hydrolase SacC (GH32 family)
LFFRWEGQSLTGTFWEPKGIAMRGDTAVGESAGGLQAPFVIINESKYLMFYGDWNRICLADSEDGKYFKRILVDGSPALFGDPDETNTRDPMVIRADDQWYCYYTAHPGNDGAIYVRTSPDLRNWSDSQIVSYGGSPGKGELWFAECPHVVPYEDRYYLFRTYSYDPPKTNVYCSQDPTNFGIDTDSLLVTSLPVAAPEIFQYREKWYIAALMPDIQGIRLAEFEWKTRE